MAWWTRLTLFLLCLAALAQPIRASEHEAFEDQVLISADQVIYDETLGVVTASGNVEIAQGGRVLLADTVSYNFRAKVVSASGNITLLDPTGDVLFADYVELTDDLREGFIRDIRVLMEDRTRLAAASGQRSGGNRTEFSKAVFSPCELCKEDPTRAPIWQLKARKVVHDQEERVIRYRDAWMEFYGVPIFYTPYLEHPDPTVERESGFLAPVIGSSDVFGYSLQVPYFWNIGPNQDATFAPVFTTSEGVVLTGEYRHLFQTGEIEADGSATISDRDDGDEVQEDEFRGHFFGTTRFDIDETWRWGLDVQRTTDDTYLRVYNIDTASSLTSNAYIEGLDGRNYASANAFLYQGLRREDDNDEIPIVLPLLDYNFVSRPDQDGNRFYLDANALGLTRREGRDTRRLSLKGGWELPYMGPLGDFYTFSASLQADGYWTDDFDPDDGANVNPDNGDDDVSGRLFPQLAVQWRYPWVRTTENTSQVIEPITQLVLSPSGIDQDDIPNEDSLDFEFDDTNLLSLNRFPGLDRVDEGSRVDYGLKWSLIGAGGGYTSAFIGQSLRQDTDDVFGEASGLADHFSDVVGRVFIQPSNDFNLSYRFRYDKSDLQARINELGLRVGPRALNARLGFTFVDSDVSSDEFEDDRKELSIRVSSKLNENWSTFVANRRDLEAKTNLSTRFGLTYQDDCFLIETVATRTEFRDRELEPEDSIFVRVVFKLLGDFSSPTVSGF
jgi:LPS-assembly protein